ncbi:MAG: hypothetical protein U0V70_18400 [Terriglobia bacterium]
MRWGKRGVEIEWESNAFLSEKVFRLICILLDSLSSWAQSPGNLVDGAGLSSRRKAGLIGAATTRIVRKPGCPGIHCNLAFRKLSLHVETQLYRAHTPVGALGMKNIIATLPGEKESVIILGSHYDTMPC